MLILIGLGIIYKNAPLNPFDISKIRFSSVLGRIGIASFIAALLYLNFSLRSRVLWAAGILLGYYAALFLVPVPGYGAGDLSFEGNLVGWIDRNFMPGRLHQKIYDENAILTQFPAACLAIFGTIAGDMLRREGSDKRKLISLVLMGVGGIVLGII
jgi:predicted acyltransferase